jgi:hypothetical protein
VSTFTSPRVFPPVIPDDAVVGGLGLAGHQVVRVFCCAGLILCPDLPAHLTTGLNGTQAPTRFRTLGPCRFRTDGHRCPRVPDVGDMLSKVVSDGDTLPALFNLHIWADRPPSSPAYCCAGHHCPLTTECCQLTITIVPVGTLINGLTHGEDYVGPERVSRAQGIQSSRPWTGANQSPQNDHDRGRTIGSP